MCYYRVHVKCYSPTDQLFCELVVWARYRPSQRWQIDTLQVMLNNIEQCHCCVYVNSKRPHAHPSAVATCVAKLGNGFKADYQNLRLLAELPEQGWKAGVWDMSQHSWVWQDDFPDPNTAKDEAIRMALSTIAPHAVTDGIEDVRKKLTWRAY